MEEPFEQKSREHKGHTITVKWYCDQDMGPPWEEHDGHGPVSEWTSRDKRAGERVLVSDRGRYYRYYDFAEAVKLAKNDGWGYLPSKLETGRDEPNNPDNLAGWARCGEFYAHDAENFNGAISAVYGQFKATMTAKQYAVGAVEQDFKYLKGWANDEWHWAGYVVEIDGEHMDSCWGIDSPSIDDRNGCGSEWTYEGFFKEAIEKIDEEEAEALDAACRDVVTT